MKIERILIGIDDSPYADNAAAYAFELANKFGAGVGLVHVISPINNAPVIDDNITGLPLESSAPATDVELMQIESDYNDNIVDRTIKKYGEGLETSHFTEYGDTAESIVNCSKVFHADLIVIGTHSRTGFDRLFMGSVAEHVVRYADVPVLVVPLKEAEKQS